MQTNRNWNGSIVSSLIGEFKHLCSWNIYRGLDFIFSSSTSWKKKHYWTPQYTHRLTFDIQHPTHINELNILNIQLFSLSLCRKDHFFCFSSVSVDIWIQILISRYKTGIFINHYSFFLFCFIYLFLSTCCAHSLPSFNTHTLSFLLTSPSVSPLPFSVAFVSLYIFVCLCVGVWVCECVYVSRFFLHICH